MLYFDHICANDRKQDRLAICSILESILYRLRVEFHKADKVSIVNDNANCYQNDLLVGVAPFICKAHKFDLYVIIHPAPQCRKGNADLHFAVGMSHIERYVQEQMPDVYCPTHVITALEYDGGLANTYTELYSIDRHGDGLGKMMAAVQEKRIIRMGRIAEAVYRRDGESFVVTVYEYSDGEDCEFIIEPDYTCRRYIMKRGISHTSSMPIMFRTVNRTMRYRCIPVMVKQVSICVTMN